MASLSAAELSNQLLASSDPEFQLMGMTLLMGPSEANLREAQELLGITGEVSQEDLRESQDQDDSVFDLLEWSEPLETEEADPTEHELEVEDMAWNDMQSSLTSALDRVERYEGKKRDLYKAMSGIRLGEWSSRHSRNVNPSQKGQNTEIQVGQRAQFCENCGSTDLVFDEMRAEVSCQNCATAAGFVCADISALDHCRVKQTHRYYPHIHFRSFLKAVMGDTSQNRIPELTEILNQMRMCDSKQQARAVLRERGLARMYNKVDTLLSTAKKHDYHLPCFSSQERELLEIRHKFWFSIFCTMEDQRPRRYFFNTKYMLLRLMHEMGIYHRHRRFIPRFVFDVESTIIKNERAWKKLFNFAQEHGHVPRNDSFQPLPCYLPVLRKFYKSRGRKRRRTT